MQPQTMAVAGHLNSASNAETARDNYSAYSYARDNGHLEFIQKAKKCDDFFCGSQWDEAIRSRLERLGKPVVTINKILATIAAVWGEQLSHRADVSFRSSKGGDQETASMMDKLWLHTVNSNNFDYIESQMAAEGFIRSRGFIDLRADFSDHMQGEARIKLLNSKNVLIDPDASSYDPDDWSEVYVTKWLTERELEGTYGKGAAQELASLGGASFRHRYDTADWLPDTFGGEDVWGAYDSFRQLDKRRIYRIIERQMKEAQWVECFVNQTTGDMRDIPDTWDRNRISHVMQQYGLGVYRKRKDKIRWTVSTDTLTLHDEISPYKHFTTIPYFPFFLHGKTIGIVENLISPQEVLNKSISQELHVINTTANSGWKVKSGSIQNMTMEELEERGAEDGLVLELDDINSVDKISPNQIPTGLDRVSFKADEALKEVSMVSDSMRGFDRADVAAKAIQAKQARGTVSLAAPFDNLDQTRRILARNTVDLWQHFYTEERVIQMAGRSLTDENQDITLNQVTPEGRVVNDLTIGEYEAVITTVPARETFEQSQFQEALEMRQAGIAIPDDVLIEHSHLNRKSEIAKRIKELNGGGEPTEQEQQMRQQLAQLELAEKQAEVKKTEADTQLKQANAALSAARAQTELTESQQGQGNEQAMQISLEREKLALDRERAAGELQLKRMDVIASIQLQREKLEAELALKRHESAATLELKEKESAAKQAAMKMKPTQKTESKNGSK